MTKEEALQRELDQAKAGTHPRMTGEEKRLTVVTMNRVRRAEQLRQMALDSVKATFEQVKSLRNVCNPNAGFICRLMSLERRLAASEPPLEPRLYRMCPFVGGPVARVHGCAEMDGARERAGGEAPASEAARDERVRGDEGARRVRATRHADVLLRAPRLLNDIWQT